MLQFKKSKDVTVDKFLCQITKSLEQEADIRASRPQITELNTLIRIEELNIPRYYDMSYER